MWMGVFDMGDSLFVCFGLIYFDWVDLFKTNDAM